MILSTHRTEETNSHPRASVWSIAIIIIISALLAVLVEPLFPNPAHAAHRNDQSQSSARPTTATDNQKSKGVFDARP